MFATVQDTGGIRWGVGRHMMAEMTPSPDGSEAEPFADFYRQRWHDAARWATALVGDRARGEELAQDAFIRIQSRFALLDNPEGYLRRTVVNLARESHRSSARRKWRERTNADREESSADVATGIDPELLAALARLPHDQRAVLVLRYWADWDETSIAESLGCQRSTVRSHAKRGLDQLRAELETDR
ncbi:MAG: sigma-70 family RNA polymerase sigma factor [Acidimicrobiia bacterium]|jgi:RNA polymerase sigma factor (sigma-70 family)|nr:sigma-70 family RNA polymerase sigma factor [Acidimicrobiia bacterium]